MMNEGILIVDNSALKFIESDESRVRFAANLRASAWKAWPSAVNYLEAAQNRNKEIRARTLDSIRWLRGNGGLLPLPDEILRVSGRAVLEGQVRLSIPWSGMEAHLMEGEITQAHEDAAREFLISQQEVFDEVQGRARGPIQATVKKHGLNPVDYSAADFLDDVWRSAAHLDTHLQILWEHLGFTTPAPLAVLPQLDPWMLFFDLYGVVAYEQAFLKDRKTRVHLPDLLQLVYLGARPGKRVVVTEDRAFQRAGNAILRGRFPRAEVTSILDFLQ